MASSPEVTAEDKKAALEGVLQTASFLRAEQLRQFLRFVCEMEISGRAAEITEYLIGVEALGRPPGYSTAEDSIVRRRAIDLRDKLDEVYTRELAGARVRIELPKGRYVPHFVLAPVPAPAPSESPASDERPAPPPVGTAVSARLFVLGVVIGAATTSAVFLIAGRASAPSAQAAPAELGITYEGEAAANTLQGATTVGGCTLCSGGGRVRNIGNSAGNYVVVNRVMAAADGNFTVRIDYFLQGQRSFHMSVNDGPSVELPLKGDSWNAPASASISVPLKAGANAIKFGNERAYAPDLDRIVVR